MALGARLQLKQEYLWSTWKQQNVGSAKQMCGSLPVEGKITLRAQVRNVTCQELQWMQGFVFDGKMEPMH